MINSPDINLTELFEVVLKSAIEAQFNANKYSAELAKGQKEKERQIVTNNDGKKVTANPYYPIPNSNFQAIGVNFKVKLEDIVTDVQRSQVKIINHIQAKLDANLPELQLINAFAKPQRISRELMKARPADPVDLFDQTIQYFALYLSTFRKILQQKNQTSVPSFNEFAAWEEDVFKEVNQPINYRKESLDANTDYRDILSALQAMASSTTLLKNIRMSIVDQPNEDSMTASIEMNVDMRTFNWENYGTK